ncbi:response regulator transcription factor [Neptunomonas marina]|uniref:Response regulator transcription factor n=1 Tax=Neptunomonas marina TaxID=1815562 RepID=A0A437Q801_9GAMM|nr:response regulator transcription factor [Neptunomonas marina]RVU30630.1 response regulator transcription factor [Neptunomonas marina]
MLNILLVDDDRDLASSLVDNLELENMTCDYAPNGVKGENLATDSPSYDVLVLDINMREMDGLTLCKRLRHRGNNTPVMMLSARDSLADKLAGFKAGADDYLVKPFEIEELIARIHALSSRRSGQATTLTAGPLVLDLTNRCVTANNEPIPLTPTGFKLTETLLRSSPEPVSHQELLLKVWGDDEVSSNKLRVHVHNLRKALAAAGAGQMLHTVSGYGFAIF